jgi:hypothetical protein
MVKWGVLHQAMLQCSISGGYGRYGSVASSHQNMPVIEPHHPSSMVGNVVETSTNTLW